MRRQGEATEGTRREGGEREREGIRECGGDLHSIGHVELDGIGEIGISESSCVRASSRRS